MSRMFDCRSLYNFTSLPPDFFGLPNWEKVASSVNITLDHSLFLLLLAHFSWLSWCLSDRRGLHKGCNFMKPCSFNLHLIVCGDKAVPCLFINVDISVDVLVLSLFAIVIISVSSLSEVFLFGPLPSWSWISPVSWYWLIHFWTVVGE